MTSAKSASDWPDLDPLRLYTPEEVIDRLRIARARVYALIKSGELPSVKIGRSRRIRSSDLAAYIASLNTQPPA